MAAEPGAAADVTLDVTELGAAYLGGTTLAELAGAGLVAEGRPGAVRQLSAALAGIPLPGARSTSRPGRLQARLIFQSWLIFQAAHPPQRGEEHPPACGPAARERDPQRGTHAQPGAERAAQQGAERQRAPDDPPDRPAFIRPSSRGGQIACR